MNLRSRHKLWGLLSHATKVEASPGFCERVVARAAGVRQHTAPPVFRVFGIAAAAMVVAVGVVVLLHPAPSSYVMEPVAPVYEKEIEVESWAEEFEGIVFMDELLAVNDPSLLDDEALARLLFH